MANSTGVSFEEVEPGQKLPELLKEVSIQQMAMYAATGWDFQPIHYDSGTAQNQGFRAAVAAGPMVTNFLAQMLTEWIGINGFLKKIACSYRGNVFPDDKLTCQGQVTNKYSEGKINLVECEVWAENQDGEKVVRGTATVELPGKAEHN